MQGSVLLTGAAGGLGGPVARRLVADGWRVVAPLRTGPLRTGPLRTGPPPVVESEILTVRADVTDEADVARAVELATSEPTAPLRAVVNLVGGFAQGGRVHETPVADFEAQLRLNVRPTYLVTAAALPYLLAAGGGSVVCVGSKAALRPFPGAAGYITAKMAVMALVDALAVEYRRDGVRVNAILPGTIDTATNRAAQPGADTSTWVAPEQIAELVAYLCSDTSSAVSGAHIPVAGRG